LGDQPKFFDQLPSTSSGTGNDYNPLFSFGFGLSYTTFSTGGLSISGPGGPNRTMTASFSVTNTGGRAGTDSVPVFVHRAVSQVVVPPHRLVGFARVPLEAGQSQTVKIEFPLSTLAVTPGDIEATAKPEVERGTYTLEVPTQVQPNNLFPGQSPPLHIDFSVG
jgi:beta-glucosidase